MDISELEYGFIDGGVGFEYLPVFSANEFLDLVREQSLYNEANVTKDGITEETTSAYLSFDFVTDFNNMPINANFGVRYEEADVESYSIQRPVIGFNWITPIQLDKLFAEEEVTEILEGDYEQFLPNLDISLEITDDLVTRFSYSKTIARSSIGAMFPATSLNLHRAGGPFRASQGNPNLLPFESQNIDLSLEYYYDDGSYISLGHFRKQVDNFISTGQIESELIGPNGPLTDPSINPRGNCPDGSVTNPVADCLSQPGDPIIEWEITTPQNLDATRVYGWEFNVQHLFGETGFGTIVNYTMVNSADEYDVYSLENDYALTGLSDSANLVVFYEKDEYQVRAAYNWRDEFLLSGGLEPTFTEAYSQLDISASYEINDHISVFLDGINITDESTRRHGRFSNQLIDYETYGPRYNVGFRGKF
ncbi:TonB-dependent receptor domain-containing protein [Alteromonas lipotrueae]|uniref:TonB-dependent receptor domain-containing protein n=1 Tax=Alteromonas lipotrueae TaxID=2803814 RepID=UPI001C4383B7